MSARSAPTRTALMRLRRRLDRVQTGAELLGRKRKALVAELFERAGGVVDTRRALREAAEAAYAALREAQAVQGHGTLRALGWPGRDLPLELRAVEVWGVRATEIVSAPAVRRGPEGRGLPPGAAGPATDEAAERFESLVEQLLDAASRELRVRRLAAALAATTRQVNVLEHRVAPRLSDEIARVQGHLEEREREDRTRLRQLRRRHARAAAAGG